MGLHHSTRIAVMLMVVVLIVTGFARAQTKAEKDKDKEECAEQLVGLATCLSYVGGEARAPMPDCCNGLKEVLKNNKKCLCVVVVDRNDPDLGLPSVCHTPANVSQCPDMDKYLIKPSIQAPSNIGPNKSEEQLAKKSKKYLEVDLKNLPADPGMRPKILEYNPNDRDQIRRVYMLKGPCQPRDIMYN